MTEYRVWTIVHGALDFETEFADETRRDEEAARLADSLTAEQCEDWQVFCANVTAGCSVGEWAGEEAWVAYEGTA